MSTQTMIVSEVDVKGYKLSVTSRDSGDDWKHLEEITYRTGVVWLIIAEKLAAGDYTMAGGSVEQEYAAFLNNPKDTDTPKPNPPIEFPETFGEPRCTIWDTYRSATPIHFHLNSNDVPQTAINTWMANQNAIDRLAEKYKSVEQKVAEQRQEPPPQSAPYNPATDTPAQPKNAPTAPNTPAQPVEGAIVATRAPKSSEVQYADGQLVSFTVTKIVASSNKGSPVYEMWTPLGSQWPTIKVYKLDTKGKEKPDYKAIVGILATLNLSLDKPEAAGTWRLIVKAAHVPGQDGDREFLNVQSLTAI